MLVTSTLKQATVWIATLNGVLVLGFVSSLPFWFEPAERFWDQVIHQAKGASSSDHDDSHAHGANDGHDDHDHSGHDHGDHGHAAEAESQTVEISDNGLKNVGFKPFTLEKKSFKKSLNVPALVVERPGHSQLQITAPLTGIVTDIQCVVGEAVQPGEKLFTVRLTHEELVESQRNLVRTAENLDVVKRELKRLNSIPDGVISGRAVLDQEYEKQRLEASLFAEYQGLLLHGLTEEQIDSILNDRQLLRSLDVHVPEHTTTSESCDPDHSYHVQSLPISRGQQVLSGEQLCTIADHCELFIEGLAFEGDAAALRRAAQNRWPIQAAHQVGDQVSDVVDGLQIEYVSDRVDVETRALRFYVRLPNEVVSNQVAGAGQRYIEWRFKPGQRMELRVPTRISEGQFVVPLEAVVEEGPETYVYLQNGNHFEQIPVHVRERDRQQVVIDDDDQLFPGDQIAHKGAYQIHLALKNKSGGGIDPHAGHNH